MTRRMTRHNLPPGAILALAMLLGAFSAGAASAVTIPTVPVGNAGNAADSTGYGAVAYDYRIGTTEVTNAQYVEFLNAVARLDTYGLYNTNMSSSTLGGIRRFGSQGSYTYSVKPAAGAYRYADKPVVFVNWGDAARFANWLHNGQPSGVQNPTTTEDGAYSLHGAISKAQLNAVTRSLDATWFLPSEDEWYKAAHYNSASDSYYNYPTGTDLSPNNYPPHYNISNSANFRRGSYTTGNPNYPLTDAGAYTGSPSPYGTFDQGGNVREWTEGLNGIHNRRPRGGSWFDGWDYLQSAQGTNTDPVFHSDLIGFRVATVPEPSTAVLAMVGCGLMLWWRKKRK